MTKILRNSPCPCGSGKKYKKCCLQKEGASCESEPIYSNIRNHIMSFNNAIFAFDTPLDQNHIPRLTNFGELYQLARIHYKIHSIEELLTRFNALSCIKMVIPGQQWKWLYCAEANSVDIRSDSYLEPIVLGHFYLSGSNTLSLNLNSWKILTEALYFLDKFIPQSVIEATEFEVVNKVFNPDSALENDMHSYYFDRQKSSRAFNDKAFSNRVNMVKNSIDDQAKRAKVLSDMASVFSTDQLPEIEKIPANIYEDGIDSIKALLKVREVIAIKHWQGHNTYSMRDCIADIMATIDNGG